MEAKNRRHTVRVGDLSLQPITVCDNQDIGYILVQMGQFKLPGDAELVGNLMNCLHQCTENSQIDTVASDAAELVDSVSEDEWKKFIGAWFFASKGPTGKQTLLSMGKEVFHERKDRESDGFRLSYPLDMEYSDEVLEKLQRAFKEGVRRTRRSLKKLDPHENETSSESAPSESVSSFSDEEEDLAGEEVVNEEYDPPKKVDSKGPVILAVQSGIGIGKSHACDHAAKLCFGKSDINIKDVLVVKVSYNFKQDLLEEKKSHEKAATGLLARMLLDMKLVIKDGAAVGQVVDKFLKDGGSLEIQTVVTAIKEEKPKAFVLAIDEIGQLVGERIKGTHEESARQVLTTACNLLRQLYLTDKSVKSTVLVTALPTLNFASLSQRQPKHIELTPASEAESENIFKRALGKQNPNLQVDDNVIKKVILTAGGHYRTLVTTAVLVARHQGRFPTLDQIADEGMLKTVQDPGRYIEALKDQYIGSQRKLRKLGKSDGVVFQNAIIPLCLLKAGDDDGLCDDEGFAAQQLVSMILPPEAESVSAAKILESHHEHWDAFRAATALPVIPDSLIGKSPTGLSDNFWMNNRLPRGLKYTFIKRQWAKDRILHQNGGIEPSFCSKDINEQLLYVPESDDSTSNHRAYESMGVAKDEKGDLCLVLYQSKAGKIADTIPNLNVAARDLSSSSAYYVHNGEAFKPRGPMDNLRVQANHERLPNRPKIKIVGPKWKHKFLFIISALAQGDLSTAVANTPPEHPTLFITDESLNAYFTPTLAQGVRRLKHLHRKEKKK